MSHRYLFLALLTLPIAACDKAPSQPAPAATTAVVPAAAAATPMAANAANAQNVALGLTEVQLRDADLIDVNGVDLGDVEYVERASDGTITGLVIEVDNTDPDRFVLISLDGLEPVRRGDDVDLRTTITREELMALPEVPRRR
jgi:hypothetical protein